MAKRRTLCTRQAEYFLGLHSKFKGTAQLSPKWKDSYGQNSFSLKSFESNYPFQILKQSREFFILTKRLYGVAGVVGSIILTHWDLTTIKKILFYVSRSNLPSLGEIKYGMILG